MIGRRALLSMPLALRAGTSVAAEPKSSGPASGTLLIVGGGTTSSAVVAVAQRHSGGASARWVVIPSAQSDRKLATSTVQQLIREGGPYSILHTEDRATADSDAFAAPLASATAVWITGGRQWRLADIYGGTRTERALHELLVRGGLIAGSSAGASIMGSYLVRGSPSGNTVLMSPGHERGFGFLRNVAIDQHIVVRGRESDLARLVAVHPEILGIGIDEGTAILVRGNSISVVGPSLVAITDGAAHEGRSYYVLKQGACFDLPTWSVRAGSP
ncbi:MAG: cyanophycinase [Reyranella sp.]|nr:cyanophycinase [Reyranella sp.]